MYSNKMQKKIIITIIRIFVIALLLFSIPSNTKADVGCALNYGSSSSEIIYFTPIGTMSGYTNYGGSPTYNNIGFPNACPRYNYNTALDAGGRCCVLGNCSNTTRTRVNFTPIPCPIDDYIPFIILAISSLGFFYLRRNNGLAHIMTNRRKNIYDA